MTFLIKQGDRSPSMTMTLYADEETPADLTSANEVLIVGRRAGTVIFERVVTGNQLGECQLVWQAADTSVPGDIDVEVRVTWSDGKQQTFPPEGYEKVRVVGNLGSL